MEQNVDSVKDSVEFLLYSYFGFGFCEITNPNSVVKRAIELAYKDATNQKAYNALVKTGDTKKAKADAIRFMNSEEGIAALLSSSDKTCFDKTHKAICNELINAFKDVIVKATKEAAFTYGNAQKWINMTMKYLLVLKDLFGAFAPKGSFPSCLSDKIENCKEFMHVPADRYIIEAVWKNLSSRLIDNPNKNGERGAYSDDKVKAWSTWNGDDYCEFVDTIENNKTIKKPPIIWEGPAWIEIAAKRNPKLDD